MSTMTGIMRRTILSGVVGAIIALGAAGMARADVASDEPGAILIFPKIIVDTSGLLFGAPIDTEIQMTNTSNSIIAARCFLVNATSHCSNSPDNACTDAGVANGLGVGHGGCAPGGACVPQWSENDFRLTLTKRQPISWKASEGVTDLPCDQTVASAPGGGCFKGQTQTGFIIPAQEDPFVGELKCIEADPTTFNPTAGFNPVNNGAGDLKGEATIVSTVRPDRTGTGLTVGLIDARKYNAIGIQSTTTNNGDDTLLVGGPGAEYNGCPNVIILDHLFDGATVVTHKNATPNVPSATVTTDLTVIPCSEDFRVQENNLGGATLQFLVFNEFEQRFSTSTKFTCFREVPLSDIDTRPGVIGDTSSIFNVGVEGTLSGQTRIRPVGGPNSDNRILAVAETFWTCTSGPNGKCSTADNVHFSGDQSILGDRLIISPQVACGAPNDRCVVNGDCCSSACSGGICQ